MTQLDKAKNKEIHDKLRKKTVEERRIIRRKMLEDVKSGIVKDLGDYV